MFTGIVGAVGTVEKIEPVMSISGDEEAAIITVDAGEIIDDLGQGGSLAVNGVCLTATRTERLAPGRFIADVMGETLCRTNLGALKVGAQVNLERCMPAGGRFDGHVVQGHVDGLGTVAKVINHESWRTLRINIPHELSAHLVEKGSITVSGASLTVTAVSAPDESPAWFEIGLIPVTLAATTLGDLTVGDTVNLETDALAKYIQRILEVSPYVPAYGGKALHTFNTAEQQGGRRGLDSVESAVEAIRQGRAVVAVDDEDRENEGDIIFAAEHASEELLGFTVRFTSGVLCAPMPNARADELNLLPMLENNQDPKGTAYTVSCDAVAVESTGISALDRATTFKTLAAAESGPESLTRPGHVFPLRAVDGGVAERPGHTEAAVQLCQLAGLSGVAGIAELVHDSGSMMRFDSLRTFATEHNLPMIAIADLVEYLKVNK